MLLYFGIPLLIPLPLSVFIASSIKNIMLGVITPAIFWGAVSISLGVFLLIYMLYFAATYVGYKRNVI